MKNNTYKQNTDTYNAPEIFEKKIPSGGSLLTIDDLSALLNVKVKTLYSMVHRSEIPFIKVGRLLRFNREQIEIWLSKGGSHVY